MTVLHLIALPYGDPDDLSLRALRLLGAVAAVVVASGERPHLLALAAHHGIALAPLLDPADTDAALTALDAGDVALVTASHLRADADAIVQAAWARGVKIEPIPGADLVIAALVLSALPPDSFVYIGRLPIDRIDDALTDYIEERATLVMTLDAARVRASVVALRARFGDRPICVTHRPGAADGFTVRGSPVTVAIPDGTWVGEAAIVIGGAPERAVVVWDEAAMRAALRMRLADGDPLKVAAKALAAQSGWDRRAIYALGVAMHDDDGRGDAG
ncbi:MAG: hypothetical protein SGJ24_13115 [Chloroflexota bacterium]|nr:hypothetical protein [Chloroflexota bacterium]